VDYGSAMAQTDAWDPDAYLRWPGPRTHPVLDLLGHADHPAPGLVLDLGCGPGNNTELIADHWQAARVIGVDSSLNMIEAARSRERPGRLEFLVADIRDWRPSQPVDVVLANAVLQFFPDHMELLPRLASFLAPGGVLGFQLPASDSVGSIMDVARALIASPAWRDRLDGVLTPGTVRPAIDYLAALGNAGLTGEAWETVYLFPLAGPGSIAEYAAGSVLRPALYRLDPAEADRFLADYTDLIHAEWPPQVIGGELTDVLRQRRVFAVGRSQLS
jgi:trans-aconitate 2-methyltransferase